MAKKIEKNDKQIKKEVKSPTKKRVKQIKFFESISLSELEGKLNDFLETLNRNDYIYTKIVSKELGTMAFVIYEGIVPIRTSKTEKD